MTSKSPFSKVDHVGVVVRDMNKAVEYYQSLGIGPFEVLTGIISGDKRMWGKPIGPDDFKLNEKMATIGPIRLQLIQPVDGDSVWKEFLDTRGEGVHHVSFQVDDIDGLEAMFEERGLPILYRSRYKGGGGSVNVDTSRVGGVIFEFIQWPPK